MSDVEILSKRTFGGAEKEVLDRFVEYQQALIDKNEDKLNELMADDYILTTCLVKNRPKPNLLKK